MTRTRCAPDFTRTSSTSFASAVLADRELRGGLVASFGGNHGRVGRDGHLRRLLCAGAEAECEKWEEQ